MLDQEKALIIYGLRQLAEHFHEDCSRHLQLLELTSNANDNDLIVSFANSIGDEGRTDRETQLKSIFSLVNSDDIQNTSGDYAYKFYAPAPLSLNTKDIFPVDEVAVKQNGPSMWELLSDEIEQIAQSPLELNFTTFYYLYQKYAWAIPASKAGEGVSLFEEWKAISALVFASGSEWKKGPGEQYTLIGGDIPGIQDFVYTVTSKGAAKGLRGRSFFIQLIGDAVVRSIVSDLELSLANVIYSAGGNFMILGPYGGENTLKELVLQINQTLINKIYGNMALAIAAKSIRKNELVDPAQFREHRTALGKQIAAAKRKPLQDFAEDWQFLFAPKGDGTEQFCAVCRRELRTNDSRLLRETGEYTDDITEQRICHLCESFNFLARDIRHELVWMMVDSDKGASLPPYQSEWSNLLAEMTGFRYEFSHRPPSTNNGSDNTALVFILNELNFVERHAHGYRLLASVTPTVTKDDIAFLREKIEHSSADGLDDEAEIVPRYGDIRSFTLLAHAAKEAQAIERVGVLRMDVDGLGHIFGKGMPHMNMLRLSTLSNTLERFFGGYLNYLVWERNDNDLYIIYAGGDDLFIVGAWHHLPNLAHDIRTQFKAYAGHHPQLSISGGITLENPKFPLYRAAERAGEAEDAAKRFTRPDGRKKDAIVFLGTVVPWEDWEANVETQKNELLWLIGANPATRLPRALIQTVQSIHRMYQLGLTTERQRIRERNRTLLDDQKQALPDAKMYLGRWMWMQVYSLTRMLRQFSRQRQEAATEQDQSAEIESRLHRLQQTLLTPGKVQYSGLVARWVEYLIRNQNR